MQAARAMSSQQHLYAVLLAAPPCTLEWKICFCKIPTQYSFSIMTG